jgi:hypothetical protein
MGIGTQPHRQSARQDAERLVEVRMNMESGPAEPGRDDLVDEPEAAARDPNWRPSLRDWPPAGDSDAAASDERPGGAATGARRVAESPAAPYTAPASR